MKVIMKQCLFGALIIGLGGMINVSAETIRLEFNIMENPFSNVTYPDWYVAPNGNVTADVSVDSFGLRIFRPAGSGTSNTGNAAVYYVGTQGSVIDGRLSQYSVKLDTTFSGIGGDSTRGIMVGVETMAYNTAGYYIAYRPISAATETNKAGIGIWKNPTNHNTNQVDALAYVTFSKDLIAGQSYTLQVLVTNSLIQASLLETGSGNNLGTVTLANPDLPELGYFGLRSGHANTNNASLFNNIEITPIPEPATIAWVTGLLVMAVALYKRRRN